MKRHIIYWGGYFAAIFAAVAIFLIVRSIGETSTGPNGALKPSDGSSSTSLHVLLALSSIVLVARLAGFIFEKIGQPPVLGEVVAGLMLGPSLLGRFAPQISNFIVPTSVVPGLAALAHVGVVLYMFVIGLKLDAHHLQGQARVSLAVSHASIVVPFSLGSILALFLYERYSPPGIGFTPFALFVGVSLSVTAFPVLARILTDFNLVSTRLGAVALACASVDDVTAWCLLAFVIAIVEARGADILVTVGLTAAYIAAMLILIRPWMKRLSQWRERQSLPHPAMLPICFAALLVSSLVTEAIGIHALFGAFMLGAIIPQESSLAKDLIKSLEGLVVILLLPAFFALTGIRTQLGLLEGAYDWLILGVIVVVASLGKMGGTTIAARLTGLGWAESTALGALMNTRGLMQLVVLNVGLDMGVISSRLFAMMVLMAIITTFATAPILKVLKFGRRNEAAVETNPAPALSTNG